MRGETPLNTELRLLEGTGSPSGRYAFAWGVSGVAKLEALPEKKLWDALDRVRNYVVEKKTLRVVATLPLHSRSDGQSEYKSGGNHWSGVRGSIRNHSHLSVLWNPTEDTLVVIYGGKWWYNAVYFGEKMGQGYRFIEIGDAIEDFVRLESHRRKPRLYNHDHKADGRDPYVDLAEFEGVEITTFRPGLLSFGVECNSVYRAKQEDSSMRFTGVVELRVRSTPHRLSAVPTRFRLIL